MLDGLRHAVRVPAFRALLVVVVILMGSYNGVITWVERILAPAGSAPTMRGCSAR